MNALCVSCKFYSPRHKWCNLNRLRMEEDDVVERCDTYEKKEVNKNE